MKTYYWKPYYCFDVSRKGASQKLIAKARRSISQVARVSRTCLAISLRGTKQGSSQDLTGRWFAASRESWSESTRGTAGSRFVMSLYHFLPFSPVHRHQNDVKRMGGKVERKERGRKEREKETREPVVGLTGSCPVDEYEEREKNEEETLHARSTASMTPPS